MSEEKFSKCGKGKKNVSVEFRVFGKEWKLKEKFQKKNQSVYDKVLKLQKVFGSRITLFVGRHVVNEPKNA